MEDGDGEDINEIFPVAVTFTTIQSISASEVVAFVLVC